MMNNLTSSLLDVSQNLMRIHTTADRPLELQRAVRYVIDLLSPYTKLHIKQYKVEEKPSVIISTQDTLTPDVLMMGHLDVVPGPDNLFEPKVQKGILYGRGACDMKSEIAVMLDLMMRASQQTPAPNIALMLTCDEEIGGNQGARHLINELGYRPTVALVPDGGEAPHDLITANKGVLQIRLLAEGVAAHASRPWLGKNAILEIINAYHRIEKLFPEKEDESRWYVTCSLNVMQAGTATNLIPCAAEARMDIRFPESETAELLLARIQKAADPTKIEVLTSTPASLTAPDRKEMQKYIALVEETTGEHICFGKSHGANDGRFLTAHGIPIIVSRPKSGGQHSDEEWVDIESLALFHEIYRLYMGIN